MKYFDTIKIKEERIQSLFLSLWNSLNEIKPSHKFSDKFQNGDISEREIIYVQWIEDSWFTLERESLKKPIAYLPGEFKTTKSWGIRTTSRMNAYSNNETIAIHPNERVKAYNIIPFKKLKEVINSLLKEYSIEEIVFLLSKSQQKKEI